MSSNRRTHTPEAIALLAVIPRNVIGLRALLGLSREALAKRSGVSVATLAGVEAGHSQPSLVVLAELAHALEVEPWHMLVPDAASLARHMQSALQEEDVPA